MRILSPCVAFVVFGASLSAQSTCSSTPGPATTLATMNPFAGGSLYGHPGYPTLPGPTFPGFSYLIDCTQVVDVEVSRIDMDLYDDGNLVQVNPTTTVVSPNQIGATAPVTVFLYPSTTWVGNETNPNAWGQLAVGTLTVAAFHTDSQILFSPPLILPAGTWGICIQVPQTQNGPNPGPLHPMVDPATTTQGIYNGPGITMVNVNFQRESWTASLTSPAHTQSLEFHYQPVGDYANWTTFGAGCGQPTPQLGLLANPVVGTTFDLETSNIAASSQLNFWLLGFAADPVGTSLAPFGLPGCTAWLQLNAIINTASTVTAGVATLPITIPSNPTFSGVTMFAQAAPLIAGTNLTFHTTNAICIAFGLY